ncbi:hypothetical protein HDU98_008939 [Podochytrium sp. JEL0797]|nr:hypothetical protein HDU98_008939 [Podochytrium sp. JEL0797]
MNDDGSPRLPAVVFTLASIPSLVVMIVALALPRMMITSSTVYQIALVPPANHSLPVPFTSDMYFVSRFKTDSNYVVGNASWPTWPVPMSMLLPPGHDPAIAVSSLGYAFGLSNICAVYNVKSIVKVATVNRTETVCFQMEEDMH